MKNISKEDGVIYRIPTGEFVIVKSTLETEGRRITLRATTDILKATRYPSFPHPNSNIVKMLIRVGAKPVNIKKMVAVVITDHDPDPSKYWVKKGMVKQPLQLVSNKRPDTPLLT